MPPMTSPTSPRVWSRSTEPGRLAGRLSGVPGKRCVFVRFIRRTEVLTRIAGLRQDVVRVWFKRSQWLWPFGCQCAFAGHPGDLCRVPRLARGCPFGDLPQGNIQRVGCFRRTQPVYKTCRLHLFTGRVKAQYGAPHEFADADAKAVGSARDRKFLRRSDENDDAFAGFGSHSASQAGLGKSERPISGTGNAI